MVVLRSVAARALRRTALAAALTGLVATLTTTGPGLTLSAAHGERSWPGHPGRHLVTYRVHPGDTATRIAVRFHAWTAELLAVNHKTVRSYWYVGERVLVPVVTARAHPRKHHVQHHPKQHIKHHVKPHVTKPQHSHRPSRAAVRDEVIRVARRHHVRPHLALAIAWQESGWQQHVRSPAGAIGAMQVMPGTGRWISTLVGRRLHLHRLHDNVVAGVVLFRVLRQQAGVKRSLAGYYQGLGSVEAHGRYPSTKRYVRNVRFHWHRLDHGWRPLH